MPNYLAHCAINFSLGSVAVCGGMQFSALNTQQLLVFSGSFLCATFFLSPDLDLHYSSPSKNWGPLRAIWLGYSLCCKHRGLSHSILFSTLTRLLYLALVGVLLLWSLAFAEAWWASRAIGALVNEQHLRWYQQIVPMLKDLDYELLIVLLAGIFSSDLCHILADKTLSAGKALLR